MGSSCTKREKPLIHVFRKKNKNKKKVFFELQGDFPQASPKIPKISIRNSVFDPIPLPYSLYSPNDDFQPTPSLPALERSPLYNLRCLIEGSVLADASLNVLYDFFYKGNDMRSKFGIRTFEIRLYDYCGAGTHTASSVTAASDEHLYRRKEDLELVIINNHLDEDDERLLGESLVEIARRLEDLEAPMNSLVCNFIQIRRSKRLSGNFAKNTHSNSGCLEELREIWIAHAEEPMKTRLARMLNVHTACNENNNLLKVLQEVMDRIETRHHMF